MMSIFFHQFRRDILLALRRRTDALTPLFFFVIVISLFPLGLDPEKQLLQTMGPGVLWVSALLSTMLSLGRLFAEDHEDGSLEQTILNPAPLSLMVLAKIMAHWCISGLPLVLIAPILGLQYQLESGALIVLTLSLLIGTPVLGLVGAIGAALTLGIRGGNILISVLILPLYIPVLIFGAGSVEAYRSGIGLDGHFYLLGACLVFALCFAPWAASSAVKISTD
ncbi:MAG: heme exporter protein CcmB [Gammaproteobacteria bacterium]|nr:MAG: heme exporter protein CcmB [Gammaproteobacteria bacterium]